MSSSVWGNEKTKFFDELTPDQVLKSIEGLGHIVTGRLTPMASMENRVYEIEIENDKAAHISQTFLMTKFYRPGRWSQAQIQDEHDFLFDLLDQEIQVIAPIRYSHESIFETENGLYFAVFPKMGGRACDEWTDDLLEQMGRLLGRLHAIGRTRTASHRLRLDIKTFGEANLDLILKSTYLPLEFEKTYHNLAQNIFQASKDSFSQINYQRVHGDCHHGNILLNQGRPFLIDFDDMSQGPCVQDIWMTIPGRDQESVIQRELMLEAYQQMNEFDRRELKLIEPLRALRIIHFSAWISHRYEDSSFQRAFPSFGSHQYWEQEIAQLREQLRIIEDRSWSP